MTVVLDCKSYNFEFNKEKEAAYQAAYPNGGYLGLCDVIIDGITLEENMLIYVKDNIKSPWIQAVFNDCHDGEIYATTVSGQRCAWRYASLINEKTDTLHVYRLWVDKIDWDEYDSCIIVARTPNEALAILEQDSYKASANIAHCHFNTSQGQVHITEIDLKSSGIICSSFNAG